MPGPDRRLANPNRPNTPSPSLWARKQHPFLSVERCAAILELKESVA
jgi:hypothetical protein